MLVAGSISFNMRRDIDWYPQVLIVDSAKGWVSTFFYCKDVAPPNRLEGLTPFTDTAGTPMPSWKKKPSAKMPADHAAIQVKISELTSGSPPLTGEDIIICWVKRRIQPLQHRTRLLCEYTDNADPMRTSDKDMDEELYHARLNRLIKARPNEGRQYEESMPMYTASNPPPKVLCRKQSSILCRDFIFIITS